MPDHDPKHRADAPNPLVSAVAHHMHLDGDEEPGERRPRDPGSGGMRFLAWVTLLVAVGFTVWSQWLAPMVGPAPTPVAQTEMAPPGGLLRIAGRYAVGAESLTTSLAASSAEEEQVSEMVGQLAGQVEDFAAFPEDRLRAAIVRAELEGAEAARAAIDELEADLDERDEPLAYDEQLRTDIESVRGLLGESPVAPADADAFRERHGWFGDLALAQGLGDDAPAKAPVLAKAERTAITAIVGVLAFVVLCVIGFVLGIVAVVLVATRKLRSAYRPHAPGGTVYLEIFMLFIVGFLGVKYASEAIYNATSGAQTPGQDYSRFLIWLLLLVPFWALIRGARASDFRQAMGWHFGKGLFRETAAGVIGYVACLPIFLAGIALTFLMMLIVGLFSGGGEGGAPSHPIIDEVDVTSVWSVLGLYMVAAVWAPIVEESIFRGALYHHMRYRLHPLVAGLGVAFVFAVIHPQGIIAVPALMSLAVTFALLREWRGSIVAPVVAHALHNGALMSVLVVALS